MAYETQKYDKDRNSTAAGTAGAEGALSGFASGAGIGAAAGAAATGPLGGLGAIPGALIGGLIGAATIGAGSAGVGAWTDDTAQKNEIKASEESAKAAERADKENALDAAAIARADQRPGQYASPSMPSGSLYMPPSGRNSYDVWKAQL